jgi:catechol 2,3-dioxygenase-like lactoylglutathione lyase family enzyme
MKISGIKETCIYVADLDRTENFYSKILLLGIHSRVEGNHVFFRAGNAMLLCFLKGATEKQNSLPPHYAQGNLHFAFEAPADDYEKWKQRLTESGVNIEHEQLWKNNLKSCYFRDPDGHLAEILQPGIWE